MDAINPNAAFPLIANQPPDPTLEVPGDAPGWAQNLGPEEPLPPVPDLITNPFDEVGFNEPLPPIVQANQTAVGAPAIPLNAYDPQVGTLIDVFV